MTAAVDATKMKIFDQSILYALQSPDRSRAMLHVSTPWLQYLRVDVATDRELRQAGQVGLNPRDPNGIICHKRARVGFARKGFWPYGRKRVWSASRMANHSDLSVERSRASIEQLPHRGRAGRLPAGEGIRERVML